MTSTRRVLNATGPSTPEAKPFLKCRKSRMFPCGVSESKSLSVVRAVMTHLTFPRPLERSSPRCRPSTSTEELLAAMSAWGWGCHLGVARAGGILAVNQGRAALVLHAQHTASHKEKFHQQFRGGRASALLRPSVSRDRGRLSRCLWSSKPFRSLLRDRTFGL